MTTEVPIADPAEHDVPLYVATLGAAVHLIETIEPGIAVHLHEVAGDDARVAFLASVDRLASVTARLQAMAATAIASQEVAVAPVEETDSERATDTEALEVVTYEQEPADTIDDNRHDEESMEDETVRFMRWLQTALTNTPSLQGRTHIRLFVEAYYGKRHVERDQHEALIAQLNGLLSTGIVERRGPFYSVRTDELQAALSQSHLTLETPVEDTTEDQTPLPEALPAAELSTMREVERSELNNIAKAVLQHALSNEFVRVEKMRKELPELSSMDQATYDEFKLNFKQVRDVITSFLDEEGIDARWTQDGKARGVKYHLVMSDEARAKTEAIFASKSPEPDPNSAPAREQDIAPAHSFHRATVVKTTKTEAFEAPKPVGAYEARRAVLFAEKFLRFLQGHFDEQTRVVPLTDLTAAAMDRLPGVARAEMRHAILGYVAAGDLHKAGTVRGQLQLSNAPVEVVKARRGNGQRETAAEQVVITADVQRTIHQVVQELIKARHHNRGVVQADLVNALGIDKVELQKVLKTMTESGLFQRRKAWERSRSPHSKVKETMRISFADQNQWNAYRSAPDAFIDRHFPIAEQAKM
jgi:transcription initiation factor IIE alpha subunit